jgi:Asp-tRNA(Asn)/Glu-tRNA(Gln) amidotransferase A subunit family amidase
VTTTGEAPGPDESIPSIVGQIQRGELKAEAYARSLLDRCTALGQLNAIITLDPSRVLAAAHDVDRARSRGDALGPLAGVPVLVKDQMDVAGYPTTAGNGNLRGYDANRSASVIDRLAAAGGYVFAKTNCGDMVRGAYILTQVTNSNPFFGFARNPYDLGRIPGGSSGGNGVALAAGLAPAALGEDTGGSIRIPAAFCGVSGLRPSTYTLENALTGDARKRYPDDGMVPPAGLLETWGPMARTAADVAYLDAALTGEPVPRLDIASLRLGVPDEAFWESELIEGAVVVVVRDAFDRLREAGATLAPCDLAELLALARSPELGAAIARPATLSFPDWLNRYAPGISISRIEAYQRDWGAADTDLGSLYPPVKLSPVAKVDVIGRAQAAHRRIFAEHGLDALAFPTVPLRAPPINPNGDTPGQCVWLDGRPVNELHAILSFTRMGPRLGAPGISLPAGLADGLPVGLLLEAAPGTDSRLLGVAVAVEAALGPLPPARPRLIDINHGA